jgi:DNA ligase-associated metallophosphoesterase
MTVEIEAGGERLQLWPDKAVFLPAHRTLLVADLHLGKAVSFRRWGVPVPHGTTGESLERLSALAERLAATRIVFLGDFLHSPRSQASPTLQAALQWRARYPQLELTLVRGNHDLRAGDPPPALGITLHDEPLHMGGLALCHHPRPRPGAYVLAGHLHPCTVIGRGLDSVRLPCFWFGDQVGVLPAFGSFTGMHRVRPAEGDRLFAATATQVLPVA